MQKRDKDFRCFGKNKKGRNCEQLLFKYKIQKDEVIVSVKCPSCNTFNILHIPYAKKHEQNNHSK